MIHITHLSTCQVSSVRGNATTSPDSINQQASRFMRLLSYLPKVEKEKVAMLLQLCRSHHLTTTHKWQIFIQRRRSWERGFHSVSSVYSRRRWVVSFTPQPPYPWTKQWLPLSGRMCGPLNRSDLFPKENTLATTESRKPDRPVRSLYRVFHTKMHLHKSQVTISQEG